MNFSIERSQLLKPLQQISGVLGGRPTLPILGNLLIVVEGNQLSLTATDLEVEMIGRLELSGEVEPGQVTVPSRKLLDICRGLPDDAVIQFSHQDDRVTVRSGRSRFTLATLPAADFPNIEDWQSDIELVLTQSELRRIIEKTQFSMANQDVRYYLNGMLFEVEDNILKSVATDGHRMAVSQAEIDGNFERQQIILPRKGVLELMKLLDVPDATVTLQIGQSNVRAQVNHFVFTSKLVDGRFPDYRRVLPKETNKTLLADGESLRQSLARAAILSNEKFRGVRVNLADNQMRVTANNPEQEEAEEVIDVDYQGDPIEIGFNVSYLLDILNTLRCEQVRFSMTDANASTLVENVADEQCMYVVMPIRL